MDKKETILSFFISSAITLAFFYKVIAGFVPFPGDLLLGEVKPWSTYSYFGYNPGSIPNKAQYPDVIRQLYPWKMLAVEQIKTGEAPLWNPHNFSGTPLLANFQSAPYYPLNILYVFLPSLVAWTILVMLQVLLSLWFTYLYARKLFISPLASWFAGISYAASLYMTVIVEYNTIGHVILWLPLIFLSIEYLKEKWTKSWRLIFIFSLTNAALAGHPQIFFYLLLMTWLYCFVRKRAFMLFFYSLLSIGIAAIQYIPGLELIQNAARNEINPTDVVNKLLIKPWQLLMLAFPNIFGNPATRNYWPADTYAGKVTSIGLIPLFFVPAFLRIRQNSLAKLLLAIIIFVLILVTANPLTHILANISIPLWSTSNPTLMTFLLAFALSVGCAMGIDAWAKEKHSLGRLRNRTLFVIIAFGVAIVVTRNRAIVYGFMLALTVLVAFTVAIRKPKFMHRALLFLLLVHMTDLFVQFHKFNPVVPASYVFPPAKITEFLKEKAGLSRIWGYGNAHLTPNLATQLRLYSPDGYDPLYPRWYGEFIGGSKFGTIGEADRSDAMIVPGFGELDLPSNINRLRVLDALGVRYILDRSENASTMKTFPPSRFLLMYEQDGWKIFENLLAAPRAFIAQSIETYDGKTEFSKEFFKPEFDPTKTVLVEKSTALSLSKPQGGTAEILSYTPNKITIQSQTTTDSLLFLSDTYYPGWFATIDGKETKIIKANYAFRSVVVPEGSHTVVFRYEPRSFSIGKILSILNLIALFFI